MGVSDGINKTFTGAITGTLADQWKIITVDDIFT
jgi:hypothetical protein